MSKEVQHCYCQTQTTVEEKFKLKKIVKRDFCLFLYMFWQFYFT